jgi:hypothetical protein
MEDPRWRTLYELTLHHGADTASAVAAIRGAEGIEILEETDA